METGRGSQLPSKRGSILGKGGLAAITNRPSRFNVEEHERLMEQEEEEICQLYADKQVFSLWEYNAANLADKVLEVYNEKRRDMVWVSFVLTCITLPIFVFCVDVYFYIQSHGILKTLDEHKKLCEEKKSSNFAKVNSTVYNQTVIDEYKYALEGRYRPCLLLSVVLSVGMSIFFRMIILGYRHRDIPSTVVAILAHSILPIYMNVCVVKMDEYLLDVNEQSVVHQIHQFKKCYNLWDSPVMQIAATKVGIKQMQLVNRVAKTADWLLSGILLVFVSFNYFRYLDKKLLIRKRIAREAGPGFRSLIRSNFLLSEIIQVFTYTIALISFPLMFSVPFCIHTFWEEYEENGDSLVAYYAEHGINMNMLVLVSGTGLWMGLLVSSIYHIVRMVIFSNKTEPPSTFFEF